MTIAINKICGTEQDHQISKDCLKIYLISYRKSWYFSQWVKKLRLRLC